MVYKAKCHWLNRFVAVKILKDDLAQDEEFRRRFHEESQAIAMLSHPNIVAVYDVGQSPDLEYLVMELIDGITLKQYMQKRGGKLSWKEALHFITQVLKGLSHAHSRGIIHRDIKPHNIMVLRDGSVKVADFGIARLASSSQNTMTQEALGSVHYISPEQARGSRIDARSDIYSAGVVLYEMLTGRLPYEGDSPVAVAIQHINSIPLSPRELEPDIPEAMESITMKAMSSDLDKRYISADAMLADLEKFRKNPNISFEYTMEDLLAGEGDEPTHVLGANTPQSVSTRPVHAERYEDSSERRRRREEEEDYEEGGGGGRVAAIILALLVCLAGMGAFLWETVFKGMTAEAVTYSVPDVRGQTLEQAQAMPEVAEGGFTVVEGQYLNSETVEKDQIIFQEPAAGTQVKAGEREISVTISTGPGGLLMPRVCGQDQRVAASILKEMGLVVHEEQAHSSEVTQNYVISQEPVEDVPVEKGQEVTIVVSLGPDVPAVTMIKLTGMTLEGATRAIAEMGLRMGDLGREPSDEYPEGQVCYQSTPERTKVPRGTIINLKVSTGPEATASPEATQPPEVSPSPAGSQPPALRRKEIEVLLPVDRDTVTVRIEVDGVEQIPSQSVDTRMQRALFTLEGSGVQTVDVYIDDVLDSSTEMDFST